MFTVVLLIVIGTSIWVWVDARSIGARSGLISGVANMGPFAWFLCCLLLWIVAFPIYLAKRGAIRAAAQAEAAPASQVAAEQPTLRACPFCAEPVRVEAIKCKHCGSDITVKA